MNKTYILEFMRYVIVGGSAFIIDLFLLYIFKSYILDDLGTTGIYISTAIGFIGGLIYNYALSIVFVFENAKKNNKGKSLGSFIIFSIIGIIGLGMTEFGMYVGLEIIEINYLIVKIFVTGIVLFWNYVARKILIFKE